MDYADHVQFQVDYAFLEKIIVEHYAHYPPLCPRQDVIDVKNGFSKRYGYDALCRAMEWAYEVARKTQEDMRNDR